VLLELRLRNVAVIEAVTLPLAGGLNVLTGETGAGKSLIVGALGLLLGERAAADRIRAGHDRASVEATFDARGLGDVRAWLDARGIDADDETLILKREVSSAARSRAWVNGTAVTVAVLRALGAQLITVHGQHEAQQLLDAAAQRSVLDAYAGATELAHQVSSAHARVLVVRETRTALEARRVAASQRADYLRFLVDEIDAAKLQPGEDEQINAEHRRLAHAEELRRTAEEIVATLQGDEGAVLDQLGSVQRALGSLQRIDPSLERLQASSDAAYYALEELARELATYADSIEADPLRLRVVDARRTLLHQLVRKHGPTVDDVLATAEQARNELALVDDIDSARATVERELQQAMAAHGAVAAELTRMRTTAALTLADAVGALLPELGMVDGQFLVQLAPLAEAGVYGAEQVQFLVALNAGTAPGPLDRVASGGELARVMLAVSTVLARLQAVPTLVFDEVDAGVGGAVAWQVGALMRRVASHHQVLAISHLAQIAACAHHHVVVRKARTDGFTTSDTETVRDDARVLELARMLGGDAEREVSRAHARELLERGAAMTEPIRGAGSTPAAAPSRQRRGKPR